MGLKQPVQLLCRTPCRERKVWRTCSSSIRIITSRNLNFYHRFPSKQMISSVLKTDLGNRIMLRCRIIPKEATIIVQFLQVFSLRRKKPSRFLRKSHHLNRFLSRMIRVQRNLWLRNNEETLDHKDRSSLVTSNSLKNLERVHSEMFIWPRRKILALSVWSRRCPRRELWKWKCRITSSDK